MKEYPAISAVFVSWNRKDLLQAAVQSLKEQGYPNLEFIVVDNGSTDGSLEWLREQDDIRLIENGRNAGASAARNQGTRIADGDYVIYMDSDAELKTPGALQRLVERMENEQGIGGMAGVIYSDEALQTVWCWSPCMDWEGNHDCAASLQPSDAPRVLSTCFCLFRLPLIREIGGFDEYYFYLYEDGDLCERVLKRGFRLMVDPGVKILHRISERGRMTWEKIEYHYYHEQLRMYYVLKNWGIMRYIKSSILKFRNPVGFLRYFDYLPVWCFIDIYLIRASWLLIRYPWLRLRRRKNWIIR